MAGLCRPTERAQLVVGDCLKLMLRHETKALKLSPRHTVGLSLVVAFQSIHCIGVHRMVGKQLLPDFNAYAFSYELGIIKPDPTIYRSVCNDLGVVPGHLFEGAAQVAMIGDSPRCDRDGPRAIGIKGFYLNRSGTEAIRNLMQFAKLVVGQSEQQARLGRSNLMSA
ncbi:MULTISPECIES: HAD family hydrolase [Pseudomonas]|uniref:Uncharacterized protein n=1 Tax=Pseudomonas putida TaxID=303 RepID=A0A2S3X4N9_PSEPU|nr:MULTISPECIES: HAD hydrolase-like protein [Pseudomonas]MBF8803185.1 hypothetical protein [Pseudomonas asiatica]MCE0881302.1 HAD hydrolase-like protein [Pseudomonas putida]MCE0969300.1 HAD hydrolase-like protein [Pseudomonas sp. NMI4491_12]MDO1494511.1 hypothetical protein [Pseudomonas putida]POG10551.1 hypothetical protein BGP84_12775 [Pseudomonas putida]